MHVAYVCTDPGIPVFGAKGASLHVQAVLRELVARRATVHLLATRTGGPVPPGLGDVRLVPLPQVAGASTGERERSAQAADRAVGAALTALHRDRRLDLVYERYALWGRTATVWARAAGVPGVLEVNAPLVHEQSTHRSLVDRPGAEEVAAVALSAAALVVGVSVPLTGWALEHGAASGRTVTVPNGVDPGRIPVGTRPVVQPDAGDLTVGFVGSLKPWHGVEVLVDAVARLVAAGGGWRLLVIGDGPRAGALRDRADAAGLGDRLEMTGPVAPDRVARHLHRMDIAVAPYPAGGSDYFSPLKVYEYLAAGVPVVASRVGQLPEVLQGGELGVLVEPGDADALAAALSGLRADVALRSRLATAGPAAVADRHTWRAAVDRILDAVARVGVPALARP